METLILALVSVGTMVAIATYSVLLLKKIYKKISTEITEIKNIINDLKKIASKPLQSGSRSPEPRSPPSPPEAKKKAESEDEFESPIDFISLSEGANQRKDEWY